MATSLKKRERERMYEIPSINCMPVCIRAVLRMSGLCALPLKRHKKKSSSQFSHFEQKKIIFFC
ncbi:hypothetical protein BpHYR1_022646 [Brachionus plicatilis]|uniref:Uncharacterized protein n=1 Tax=Brachionus plicatilis TaxID=10195 RepID=A0A3M7P1W8_BRAPC|nr:hypothetical protein BpHYR1_022646 [Brachionus plicatilis]